MCNKGRGCGRAAEHSVAGAPTIKKKKTKETKTKNAALTLTLTQRNAAQSTLAAPLAKGAELESPKDVFIPLFLSDVH